MAQTGRQRCPHVARGRCLHVARKIHFHTVSYCTDYNTAFPRYAVYDFPALHGTCEASAAGSCRGTRVVAIKGTSTANDVAVDGTLWSAIKVLQVLELLVPVTSVFPPDQVQWFIDKIHVPGQQRTETGVK